MRGSRRLARGRQALARAVSGRVWSGAVVLLAAAAASASAQEAANPLAAIPWVAGPEVGHLGIHAQIRIPEGFVFTGPTGTPRFLELTHNLPNPQTVGVLLPTADDAGYVVFFDYDDCGHVSDEDRDSINADALLAQMQANNAAANEERRTRGWSVMQVDGWVVPPGYESATNRLAWGLRLRSDAGESTANYDVRVLGRTGVMSVTLVCDPERVETLVPRLQSLLADFEFKAGHRYAEWRTGDKLASYGLTGLIVGGGAVAAAKAGWLAKLAVLFAKGGKALIVVVIAVLGGLWRLISRQTSRTHASG